VTHRGPCQPQPCCDSSAHTDLSLFLVRRLRSMPSMRFSKQRCIACCFSGGWLFTMLFLKSEKYWGRQEKPGLVSRVTATLALGLGTRNRLSGRGRTYAPARQATSSALMDRTLASRLLQGRAGHPSLDTKPLPAPTSQPPALTLCCSQRFQHQFGRGLDQMTHRGPFQPRPFCDSVIAGAQTAPLAARRARAGYLFIEQDQAKQRPRH